MTEDTLLIVGREGTHSRATLSTHAERLERRRAVDTARVVTYAEEPVRELREDLAAIDGESVFVVPACLAHSYETTDVLPGAFPYLDGEVTYCEPIGRSPALTRLIARRASDAVGASEDTTLVLVGQGNSAQPYSRQVTEYHASRLASTGDYADVQACYLLQNPAVECVRYNVDTARAVAVPLFLTENETTRSRIPAKLELDRGGMAYADPFGDDTLVTDAIEGELARQRAISTGESDRPASFEATLARGAHSLATDGQGPVR